MGTAERTSGVCAVVGYGEAREHGGVEMMSVHQSCAAPSTSTRYRAMLWPGSSIQPAGESVGVASGIAFHDPPAAAEPITTWGTTAAVCRISRQLGEVRPASFIGMSNWSASSATGLLLRPRKPSSIAMAGRSRSSNETCAGETDMAAA